MVLMLVLAFSPAMAQLQKAPPKFEPGMTPVQVPFNVTCGHKDSFIKEVLKPSKLKLLTFSELGTTTVLFYMNKDGGMIVANYLRRLEGICVYKMEKSMSFVGKVNLPQYLMELSGSDYY